MVDIAGYKANINSVIRDATADDSVTEDIVAAAFTDLADLLSAVIGGAIAADYDTLLKLANKIAAIEAIVGTSDADGDSIVNKVAEVLAAFSTYPEGTDLLSALNGKVSTSDIDNTLSYTLSGRVLDARQGKALADLIALRASITYVDTQDSALSTLITNLKAGSTETIASLKTTIDSLSAIIGSSAPDGDSLVDTVTELLAVFATYSESVDIVTLIGGKVAIADVVNVLTTTASGKVLDARAGKTLKDAADALTAIVTGHTTSLTTKANLSGGKHSIGEYHADVVLKVAGLIDEDDLPPIDLLPLHNPTQFEEVAGQISIKSSVLGGGGGGASAEDSNFIRLTKAYGGIDILGESLLAPFWNCIGNTLTDGSTRATWVYLPAGTISYLMAYIKTAGVYTTTGAEWNGMALLKYDPTTRDCTKVADTGNIATMWTAAPGVIKHALTTPYVAEEGLYMIMMRYDSATQTTAPVIMARVLDGSSVASYDALDLAISTGTSVASITTLDMDTTTATTTCYWHGYK